MEHDLPEIVRCPPHLVLDALSLVLSDVVPSQRRQIGRTLLEAEDPAELGGEPLFVALRDGQLRAAAWGQRQSGNIAMFWPPQLVAGESDRTAMLLADAVIKSLDDTAVEMIQVLLPSSDVAAVPVLKAVGFHQLAQLLYMSCEASRFPAGPPDAGDLQYESYAGSKRGRLAAVIEKTYDETLDCVGLNGMRTIDDVINGYQGTGVYRPENWQLVRSGGADIGVLLLSDHPQARHWELLYMGLVPQWRGRGLGRRIAEYAKWRAGRADVHRIVVAVDVANTPAVRMYRRAGFETWDRRTVYVRFPKAARK